MAKARYGFHSGGRSGVPIQLAAGSASEYYRPDYNHFVVMNSSGNALLADDAETVVFGWAEVPTSFDRGSDAETNGYWTASTTAGADGDIFCINDPSAIFMVRTKGTATRAAAGLGCEIDVASTCKQTVDLDSTTQAVILVLALDPDADTVSMLARVNPAKYQVSAQT